MSTNRKTYSSELKREAVELAATSGKIIKELERELSLGEGCQFAVTVLTSIWWSRSFTRRGQVAAGASLGCRAHTSVS